MGEFESVILTSEEMRQADALAVSQFKLTQAQLMETAGQAVADEVLKRFKKCSVAVMCGPGNNGGDGYVVARLLKAAKWPVEVFCFDTTVALKGAAAEMAAAWKGAIKPIAGLAQPQLIVDALFGAGLSRDFPEELATKINSIAAPIVAVDVPSGLDADTGMPRGSCLKADVTVTFFRKKPAHVLYPGRELCGDIVVADIGIPPAVCADMAIQLFENLPPSLPAIDAMAHKYSRGAALVFSGSEFNTGASRLAAMAAARIGAGAVALTGSPEAMRIHANHVSSIMLRPVVSGDEVLSQLRSGRYTAFCVGPAAGVNNITRQLVSGAMGMPVKIVMDADALTTFADHPQSLFAMIRKTQAIQCVMTPHHGEFDRLFGDIAKQNISKIEKARLAAQLSCAVVVYKGPDTVIADPDGRAMVNTNAPAKLATAGSGDVLAGVITGLMAQGMDPFEAACAGVWLHGDAANHLKRPTIIAEDLIEALA